MNVKLVISLLSISEKKIAHLMRMVDIPVQLCAGMFLGGVCSGKQLSLRVDSVCWHHGNQALQATLEAINLTRWEELELWENAGWEILDISEHTLTGELKKLDSMGIAITDSVVHIYNGSKGAA